MILAFNASSYQQCKNKIILTNSLQEKDFNVFFLKSNTDTEMSCSILPLKRAWEKNGKGKEMNLSLDVPEHHAIQK